LRFELGAQDVIGAVPARLLEHLATKTIANVHGLAHRILRDAVMDGVLPHNPADRAVKPKARDTEQPTWTPVEVADFLAYVFNDDLDWHALFATIAITGIRRGEAVGATWSATDLSAGTLEIRQTITKAGSKLIGNRRSHAGHDAWSPCPSRSWPSSPNIMYVRTNDAGYWEARGRTPDLVFPNEVGGYHPRDFPLAG